METDGIVVDEGDVHGGGSDGEGREEGVSLRNEGKMVGVRKRADLMNLSVKTFWMMTFPGWMYIRRSKGEDRKGRR